MVTAYTMRKSSKHYGQICHQCKQRIRVGKSFTIGVVNSQLLYHQACTPETPSTTK